MKDDFPVTERIFGHHRSLALAERRRRQLEREKGAPVSIEARRNRAGKFSARGKSFTFAVHASEVYVLRFSYKARKKDAITAEVHVEGPKGANRDDIITAIKKDWENEPQPGWKVKTVTWDSGPRHYDEVDSSDRHVVSLAIYGGIAEQEFES